VAHLSAQARAVLDEAVAAGWMHAQSLPSGGAADRPSPRTFA
jgi:hypothetical protein